MINNNFYSDNENDQAIDGGMIALANLPKLEKLTLEYINNISDAVFTYFKSLKSLELLDCVNVSNRTLIFIAEHSLQLQSLTIRRKFLNVTFYF